MSIPATKSKPREVIEDDQLREVVNAVAEEIGAVVLSDAAQINAAAPPPKFPREVPRFVTLAEKLAESVVEAAQARLEMAQSQLESAKAYAESVRAEAKKREDEINDLVTRLELAGRETLATHQKFHNGNGEAEGMPR